MRYNLQDGFPLVTTKKCHLKAIIHELLWFLKGDTNVNYLQANGVGIWDEWASDSGELGPVYGAMWRSWPCTNGDGLDQLAVVIQGLRDNPRGRRHLVTSWNPEFLPVDGVEPKAQPDFGRQALPPCHCLFQFYAVPLTVAERYKALKRKAPSVMLKLDAEDDRENHMVLDAHSAPLFGLSCQLYQRSADIFLGVPFNIASYALLTMMVAQMVDMVPWEFVHTLGDVHLYKNHIEQAREQLTRTPKALPTMVVRGKPDRIEDFTYEDFELTGYSPDPAIKAPVAV